MARLAFATFGCGISASLTFDSHGHCLTKITLGGVDGVDFPLSRRKRSFEDKNILLNWGKWTGHDLDRLGRNGYPG